jgi:hypothetical protein
LLQTHPPIEEIRRCEGTTPLTLSILSMPWRSAFHRGRFGKRTGMVNYPV